MAARLVNVRLDDNRLRKVKALRSQGVTLSDVVREAIDARYSAIEQAERQPDPRVFIRRLFDEHPDPPGLPAREYDVHDRRAARAAVRDALARARR